MNPLLHPIGEGMDHQLASHAAWRLAATEPAPSDAQIVGRGPLQGREVIMEMAHVTLTWRGGNA